LSPKYSPLEQSLHEGGRRRLPVRAGDGDVALARQELERDFQLAHDAAAGLPRRAEWWRVGRNARAGDDERARGEAGEVMAAALHGDAQWLEHAGGAIHRVTGIRVAGVHGCAGAREQLGGGAAAPRETDDADLAARPRGRQRFRQRADRHVSEP
jgi:hypothetical protein